MKNVERNEHYSGTFRGAAALLFLLVVLAGASSSLPDRPATEMDSRPRAEEDTYRYNYVDRSGRLISARDFDEALPFKNGVAAIKIGRSWGYIEKTGKFAIKPKFESVANFFPATDPAPAGLRGKMGYIDRAGTFVIEPKFDYAGDFSEGLAVVRAGERRGYIDMNGRIVFYVDGYNGKDTAADSEFAQTVYNLQDFKEGVAIVDFKLVVRNLKTGEEKSSFGYAYVTRDGELKRHMLAFATDFHHGMAVVRRLDDRTGTDYYIVRKNEFLAPEFVPPAKLVRLEEVRKYAGEDGYYPVTRLEDSLQNVMDREGNFVSKEWFFRVGLISGGLAGVTRSRSHFLDEHGFIDLSGNLVVPFRRDTEGILSFREGLAAAKKGGKWGYIDRTGRWAIEPRFFEVGEFFEGLAYVQNIVNESYGDWAVIDKSGQEVWSFPKGYMPKIGDSTPVFSEGFMVVRKEIAKKRRP